MTTPNDTFTNPFQTDLFSEFLELEPRAGFFSALPQGQTPNQAQFFQSQFDNVFNQFLGLLGSQVRAGQAPTALFAPFATEFVAGNPFGATAPFQRPGLPERVFAPPTRQVFF